MNVALRLLVTLALLAAVCSSTGSTTAAAPASPTSSESLAVTFLTPALGWRMTDRWNPDTGARGPVTVRRTTDGGQTWSRISTVPGAITGKGSSFSLYASRILFADPRNGWIEGQRLYATHDGGLSWKRLPLDGSQTALSLARHSVWRLDSSCPATVNRCHFTLLTSTAGSDTWNPMPWHPPKANTIGTSLARSDALHAWLLSGPYLIRNHMALRLVATVDGGRTWHRLPMPCSEKGIGPMVAQIVPYTASSLWSFCASEPSAGAQAKAVARSSDGGHTWRLVAASTGWGTKQQTLHNLTIGGYLSNAAVTSPADAWLALSRGTLLHTTDGGRTWHDAIPPELANPRDGGVGPIQFVDPRHGWLLSFPNLLFRTVDGGEHWTRIVLQ